MPPIKKKKKIYLLPLLSCSPRLRHPKTSKKKTNDRSLFPQCLPSFSSFSLITKHPTIQNTHTKMGPNTHDVLHRYLSTKRGTGPPLQWLDHPVVVLVQDSPPTLGLIFSSSFLVLNLIWGLVEWEVEVLLWFLNLDLENLLLVYQIFCLTVEKI